jgi:PAS domain S-box-containing protein
VPEHLTSDQELDRLRPILDIALDAVVLMRADGIVADWNAAAVATFGWTREEAVGCSMADLIIPPRYRESHQAGLERFNRTAEARILDQRIEIEAIDRAGREFPVELAVTWTRVAEERIFVGFLRDISERRRSQQLLHRQATEARLLFEVTRFAADTESFEEALRECLKAICQLTGWPAGHAYTVRQGASAELVSTQVWHEDVPGLARQIAAATLETRFRPGFGLPGTILQTRQPAWVSDAEADSNFIRKGSGFRAAFGFPVTSEGRIIAVLEFFSTERAEPDAELLLIVRTLGEQVGRVLERKRTEEHQRLMTKELNHRVRNNLSIIQSVAHQTFGEAGDRGALAAFESRIGALAAAHEVLTRENWEAASLDDLARQTIFACGAAEDQVDLQGPDVLLPPRLAVSFTMALHELCTNAVKYGALSVSDGCVRLTWELVNIADGERLRLAWREEGGPPVKPPARRGFGSRMIERALARELGGEVTLTFAPAGLECLIDAPAPAPEEAAEESRNGLESD